jgi:hypothetical protein
VIAPLLPRFSRCALPAVGHWRQAYRLAVEIGEILIPTEDVVEMRGRRKVVSSKRFSREYDLAASRELIT